MKAHELLSDESKWIKEVGAKNMLNEAVPARCATAVCWCLMGALARCYSFDKWDAVLTAIRYELLQRGELCGVHGVSCWNDSPERKFSEVKDLLLKLDL